MKLTSLSLKQAPPLSVPYRFFLTAPVFGAVSALLLIFLGPEALESRWTPAMLAITHGLVLGFLTSVMFGAMQQMLPVLAGAIIPRAKLCAWVLHLLWVPGVSLLLGAFLLNRSPLFISSLTLLSCAVIFFGSLCGIALSHAKSRNESVTGMKLSVVSLVVTVVLGVVLGLGHSDKLTLLRPTGTNLHMVWGLLGWIGLLITSVAWQIVPMFQITKPYPTRLTRLLAPTLFFLFLARSLVSWYSTSNNVWHNIWQNAQLTIDLVISLILFSFACCTLQLQYQRLRKIKDYHINYWQVACLSLLLSIICWWLSRMVGPGHAEQLQLLSAVLFLAGFVMAVATAMLYKIVAFLVWFHLREINTRRTMAGKPGVTVPHMKTVVPQQHAKVQYALYVLALCSLPAAIFWPTALSQLAGVLWLLHFVTMTKNLTNALMTYKTSLHTYKTFGQ